MEFSTGSTPTTDRVRENRLRRMADRQGLKLVRSRRRDPRALDYGRLELVDAATREVRCSTTSLDEIEAFLLGGSDK